jgi:hypothetical protein
MSTSSEQPPNISVGHRRSDRRKPSRWVARRRRGRIGALPDWSLLLNSGRLVTCRATVVCSGKGLSVGVELTRANPRMARWLLVERVRPVSQFGLAGILRRDYPQAGRTQSDAWDLLKGRPRAACQEGAPAEMRRRPSRPAATRSLRRVVTFWAAVWAETVFRDCEPVPDGDFEIKIRARTGRNR